MKNSMLYYSVGALLYCPANNDSIVRSLSSEKFGKHFSLALCLEDTIKDEYVEEAEQTLVDTIKQLFYAVATEQFYMPKIFIRVRAPKQITNLLEQLGEPRRLITGFIIPKFSLDNADEYIETILTANYQTGQKIFMMPIMESPTIINLNDRYHVLYALKEKLDKIEELILNIRVGGNDFCHMFGFRRHKNESIHQIKPISNIFADIITVFGMDYVISGPVWEYYSGAGWDKGLIQELREDRLCGFTGKTVIHPNQIELVNNAYKVSKTDYLDALSILSWDVHSHSLVSGSSSKERMNEYKTHSNWANHIIMLSQAFGVSQTSTI